MSLEPAYALQKMLFNALLGATGAGQNVFDRVQASDPFPRITIGGGQTISGRIGSRLDPCFYGGSESFLDIDVWSRAPGYPEAKTIAGQVREILDDADLALEGHVLELMDFESTVFSRDPDGLTSRARMSIRALTQPAS